VRQPPTEAIAMDNERQRGSALQYLVEKRIRVVIEWLQLNFRFLTYLDLQSFEVVALRNSICPAFKGFQRPRLYLSAVDVNRAPKSWGGNVPPDFAYLSETKGSAHRTATYDVRICLYRKKSSLKILVTQVQ